MNSSIIRHIVHSGIFYSFLVFALLTATRAKAQLNPLAGIYFQNEYLGNPAMAGLEKGLHVNMGFRQQWSSIPGSPKTQSLTADYGSGKKVGLGLNIHNDEAGLIKRTRVMGTYTYQLPLNQESQKLLFGISLGFMDDRVMNEEINGEQNDVSISKFNERETYVDADFGVAYTSEKFVIQVAVPNLKGFFKKEIINSVADRSSFFSAISYKLYFPEYLDGFGVEPKLAFRGIQGFDNLLDVGANFTVAEKAANVMVVYHSSESATIGMGATIKSHGSIFAHYTTATSALSGYTGGNFELGLKLNLLRKN